MLIEFSIRNFKSFKDPVTLSMVAAPLRASEPRVDETNVVHLAEDLRVLKSAAIYGPNASGKSNLAKAATYMRWFVLSSLNEILPDEPTRVEPFLLSEATESAPSLFEAVFVQNGKRYRYGFEVTQERVTREWLFFVPTTREARLFVREFDTIQLGERFREGRGLEERTRKNALFLSVVAQFNGLIAQDVLSWFTSFVPITALPDHAFRRYTVDCLENNQNSSEIIQFIRRLDLGIDHLEVKRIEVREDSIPVGMPEAMRRRLLEQTEARHIVTTAHKKYDRHGRQVGRVNFDLDWHESEGTKKLVALAGPLIDTLKTGKVLFLDEIDARLHPDVTRALVGLFNSREANPHNAQLIFTTQDTSLLTNKIFRRDQIWFVEKDEFGSSRLYSLAEFKPRNDASFENNYARGSYGAIPSIRDLTELIGEPSAS